MVSVISSTYEIGIHYIPLEKDIVAYVMTTLRKVSDFSFFLPFLFSLYHYPEPSGTFYDDPPTSVMTHILDRSSMT